MGRRARCRPMAVKGLEQLLSPKFGSTTANIINTTGFTGQEVHNISRVTIKMKISNVVSFTPVACKFCGIFDVCTHPTAFSKTSTTQTPVIA